MDPTSLTAKALERWVVSEVVGVVGGRGRTTTVQEHVVKMVEWVEELGELATGLVPGLAYQPSSTIVGSERVVLMVGWGDGRTRLSDDEDAVEDVGSELEGSKRWARGG